MSNLISCAFQSKILSFKASHSSARATYADKFLFSCHEMIKNGTQLETSVYKKETNTGLLPHFDDRQRYSKSLLSTLLTRAYHRLSSNWTHFIDECEYLKWTFSNLQYPSKLIKATINQFITNVVKDNLQSDANGNSVTTPKVRFYLLFFNQKTEDNTRKQLQSLGSKTGVSLQAFVTSKKVGNIFKTNRPLTSSLVPLFQNESKCDTIRMKITLIFMKVNLKAELIFKWMVSQLN